MTASSIVSAEWGSKKDLFFVIFFDKAIVLIMPRIYGAEQALEPKAHIVM